MLCISCLTLNLPSNEQRKSQINCPLFFFFPNLTSSIRQRSTQLQTEANRLVYEFWWGRYQCGIQYYSLRVRGRGRGPSCGLFLYLGSHIEECENFRNNKFG